jgi:tRNA pseudouridine38-40 synthase
MKKYLIVFAYDGTNYNGYQRQPKLNTVQGEIEKVLKKINNNKQVNIQASGRTDAGVHATNQTAHFELEINITCEKLKRALNSYTKPDIYVKKVEEVDESFHARYLVKKKEYIYKINVGEYDPNQRSNIYQHNKELNIKAMKKSLKYLEGEHDFTSFTCQESLKGNCICKIIKTNIIKKNNIVIISFLGNRFLKYQVRKMMGVLIDIGIGKKNSKDIINILNSKDSSKVKTIANPEGLYLNKVYY